MNTLDKARQGRGAARQIRSQAEAGVLMIAELYRLLDKVDAGFAQMMGEEPHDPPSGGRGFAAIVHEGGRT